MFTLKESMLLSKIKVEVLCICWESITSNYIISSFILLFPSINIMESHMTWQLEPSNLISVLTVSLHDPVSWWFLFVKLKNEFWLLDHGFRFKLKWRIRDDDIVFGHHKIVDHSWRFNRNICVMKQFSIFVEQRIMDCSGLHIISKTKEFACFLIDLWVSRNVMFQLSAKIVITHTFYIELFFWIFIDWYLVREAWFLQGVCVIWMVGESCISCTVSII